MFPLLDAVALACIWGPNYTHFSFRVCRIHFREILPALLPPSPFLLLQPPVSFNCLDSNCFILSLNLYTESKRHPFSYMIILFNSLMYVFQARLIAESQPSFQQWEGIFICPGHRCALNQKSLYDQLALKKKKKSSKIWARNQKWDNETVLTSNPM